MELALARSVSQGGTVEGPLSERDGESSPNNPHSAGCRGVFCPPRPGCLFRRCRSVASPLTAHPGPGTPASPPPGAGLRRAARRCRRQSSSSKCSSAPPGSGADLALRPGSIQNLLGEIFRLDTCFDVSLN